MSSQAVPLYLVGHSHGGHAFGMLPNQDKVAGFYAFGTGAGWHGWMPPLERIKVLFMWHVLGPLLTWWKGYLSWSLLGMGEDLPLDAYRQWKRWCRYANYFLGDPSMQHVCGFERLRAPLMAANSIDDRWSPPKSRDAFIGSYRAAARETLDIDPVLIGLPRIGHMGYFGPGAAPLWASALEWFAMCADIDGFSLHAAVRCGADARKSLERLCRYITRPALANERVQCNAAGQVVLKLKTAWRDGTTHLVLSPLWFMHLIRFRDVLPPPTAPTALKGSFGIADSES
jgi:Putative transposase